MNELLFKKKGTEKVAGVLVYCFWKYRDHPREREVSLIEKVIIEAMKEKGWVLVNHL